LTATLTTPGSSPGGSPLARRVIEVCREIAGFSESRSCTTRTFLSPPMHAVHKLLRTWMSGLQMNSHVDSAGNLIGVYSGAGTGGRPCLLIGSHLDTVPDAGAYDGILGVVLGLALIEALDGDSLPFDIEIVGFSEEEGVRFSTPFLGSLAYIGQFDPKLLNLVARDGVSVETAIRQFGLDPAGIPACSLSSRGIGALGYLEFHIEQGPVLEHLNAPVAAVNGIVGQSRYQLSFHGQANHAGTTPMSQRADALAAAAEWILEVERMARAEDGLVATVGRLSVTPDAGNVIPGQADASLDVRHLSDAVRVRAACAILAAAARIANARGLRVGSSLVLDQPAVVCDSSLVKRLERSIAATGLAVHTLSSGAGHDAMILARAVPSAMLFLRSPGGVSHLPAEAVIEADVNVALAVGLHFIRSLETMS
jgi:allantoate deiminase